MFSSVGLQDDSFPFEFGTFEVEDQAHPQSGDAELIDHLPHFVVGDAIYDRGVHHDFVISNEIGNIFGHLNGFGANRKALLLAERNPPETEPNSTTSEFS